MFGVHSNRLIEGRSGLKRITTEVKNGYSHCKPRIVIELRELIMHIICQENDSQNTQSLMSASQHRVG